MGSCSTANNQKNESKNIKIGDRLITCNVEYGKDKLKTTFNSLTLIKEVKMSLTKQILKNNHEKVLVKLFYNGKELKDNTSTLGSLVDGYEINLVMASIPLTEEVLKDEKKIDEMVITNLTKFCDIHKEEKALLFCLSCNFSICNSCEKDHKDHNLIQKVEIIKYEQTLRENNSNLIGKLKEMSLDGKYSDFHKGYRQDMEKQTEDLTNLVDEIKKKESHMLNEFKSKFDSIFPNILDYKDKLKDMINNVSEFKRGSILRNDNEFAEFYSKYSQITILNEKSSENLENLKLKLEKFKTFYFEYTRRLDEIIDVVNIHYNKLKDFQITENSLLIQNQLEPHILEKNHEERKAVQEKNFTSSNKNYPYARMSLINLMSSPKQGKGLIEHFDEYKKLEKYNKNRAEMGKNRETDFTFYNQIESQEKFLATAKNNHAKEVCKYIACVEASTKVIYIYDKSANTITKKELDLTNIQFKKFEVYHSTLNYANRFYISGGGYGTTKNFYEYDIETETFKKLKNMLSGHSYHSLLAVDDHIYVISGFNTKKVEKYSLESDNWTPLAELNSARCWANVLNLDNKYIYVFGGFKDNEKSGDLVVEKLDFNNKSAVWEVIEISSDAVFPIYSACLKVNPSQIYLFGGKFSTDENTNKCYSLNLYEKSFNSIENIFLPYEDEFDGKELVSLDNTDTKYGFFSSMIPQRFYIFDVKNQSFEVIKYESS